MQLLIQLYTYDNLDSNDNCYYISILSHGWLYCAGYASRGIEIPMFDGISFLNANITLGDVSIIFQNEAYSTRGL